MKVLGWFWNKTMYPNGIKCENIQYRYANGAKKDATDPNICGN
jgi:hypothetical protein